MLFPGVLATANSIMKRFRWVSKTDALMKELVYRLEQLQVRKQPSATTKEQISFPLKLYIF